MDSPFLWPLGILIIDPPVPFHNDGVFVGLIIWTKTTTQETSKATKTIGALENDCHMNYCLFLQLFSFEFVMLLLESEDIGGEVPDGAEREAPGEPRSTPTQERINGALSPTYRESEWGQSIPNPHPLYGFLLNPMVPGPPQIHLPTPFS